MTAPLVPDHGVVDGTGEPSQGPFPPGTIAGTALRSARLSAHLSEQQLAARAVVQEDTIRRWEAGSRPLDSAPADQLERLEEALRAANADPALVADLWVAAWCDLLIGAIIDGEDTSCLLADPLAAEDALRELLAWAITGQPPERHQPYVPRRRLLPSADERLTAEILKIIGTPGRPTDDD
jgi:transcriptional regulator with XRE-family HTH domain